MDATAMGDAVVVADSSALIAIQRRERGSDAASRYLAEGVAMSSVNYSELAAWMLERTPRETVEAALEPLPIAVIPFTREQAVTAAWLREQTRGHGLGIGDRSCLAVALNLDNAVVITTDRQLAKAAVGVRIELLR